MNGSMHPVWIIIASLLIAMVPVLVGVATSYIKVSIVLGMLKSGIGAQQVPGAIVVMALSFAMTLFIMNPTIDQTIEIGKSVNFSKLGTDITLDRLAELKPLIQPWREFMAHHSGERELEALLSVAGIADDKATAADTKEINRAELPTRVLMTSFVLTELKEAFAMGFILLLPFLVIDLIVANILAGMGMFTLSPVLISLPLKLLLFVLADGWILLTRGLIASYSAI